MKRWLTRSLGPVLGAWAVRLLALTLRIHREEGTVQPLWRMQTPTIYAAWHSRILLLPYLYGWRRTRVLASRSEDGELVVRFIARFGMRAVRGSSSRGGAGALRALRRLLSTGADVFVVPDGPTGPREIAKPGIVMLARLSGAPIVPMALGASREWRLASWDEFRIPKPFARCVMRFGEPIHIARHIGRDGEEAARKEVEAALHALTSQVDAEARG
ncbi:MAG TPA: lysophospholipid acyltransferase family protein [Methylomirabilota bacterium]|nr:lysophospholipid acyltransferase family protein [Methylomirabilota bacterium]